LRTRAGKEVDFVLHGRHAVLALEVKSSARAHRSDARPLREFLENWQPPGTSSNVPRLGLVVTLGGDVEQLTHGVWGIPAWRLFGPGG
jgi:predicted AAA+ superfamily ATPase